MKKKLKPKETINDIQPQYYNNKKDTSPIIPQRSKYNGNINIKENFIFTEKQKEFIKIALDKNTKIMFVSGPAGTSKTLMSVYCALKYLQERRISDLIYVRSAVECADKSIGFLPGTVDEKMEVYTQPLVDKLEELLPRNEIDALKKDDRIKGMPISYLRGLNWNAKFIVGDEFQNCTYKEILTFITRIGQFSKVMVMGDPEQSDINGKSGFQKFINMFDDEESRNMGIFVFRFNENDIVRSELVKFIVQKVRKTN